MSNLILFLLASCGLTSIIVESEIAKPFREWTSRFREPYHLVHRIVTCNQCCGFWSGIICSPVLLDDSVSLPLTHILLGGYAGSAVAPLFAGVKTWLRSNDLLHQMKD